MIDGLRRRDISRVHEIIGPYIRQTPVLLANGSDGGLDPFPLTLKLEFMQHAGSFKARGAFANLLTRPVPASGVVAASGGNHGVAVAYAAMRLGIPAKIFVPTVAAPAKIARIRAYGADVVITGERYADALEASERYAAQSRAMPIHAYDQTETLLGQGTLGRELADQVPGATTLLTAVGGGGLIGGMAAWFAGQRVRVIGVEPVGAPTLTEALKAGRPVDAPAGSVAADSLAPRWRIDVSDRPAARRPRTPGRGRGDRARPGCVVGVFRLTVEPGGAAAFAALLSKRYTPSSDEHAVVVLCGANTQG